MNAPDISPQELMRTQGTRTSERAPWETYADSLEDKSISPQLQAEIDEYAQRRHEKTSEQNKEELARWKEGNQEIAKEYQWCTPEEYADIQARMGLIMHRSELINKLRNECKLQCWYREHPHADKVTLVVQRDGMHEPETACWVQNGYMPEYTVMGFDEHGVPLAERYRGWRTVLLQLILKGMLTEEVAHKAFGPAERRCADRYNSVLHGLRNTLKED